MQVVKYILMVLYIIDCLGLIIVTMMQNSDSRGTSGTIVGSSSNNFYEKNKGRTREGKLKDNYLRSCIYSISSCFRYCLCYKIRMNLGRRQRFSVVFLKC